ncbi:fatty-acyl-CoA synthase [Fictibacillus enclensis]|uniref:AMP-binding protein n=1 Tax=Fictibacillus enclensis TaxID=1017270 RepID=A0A0V8JFE4_9BACL|nr:AMP-binding protein [Fictibacillus enclensis]KSU85794.1 AMP-binding protein [Fictibacillus enclensis]SCC02708.1 fatty-acyl-CoA synthase [Fictibacillus enclensis]
MAVNGSLTIGKYLEGQAHALASHEAVVYSTLGIRYSYQEFYELTEKVAKGLMALGVRKGDHIAVWATNVPEWILLQFGSARAGAVLVTVNTSYQQNELEYLLKQSDAKALFLIEGFKDTSYVQMAQTIQAKKEEFPFLEKLIFMGNEAHDNMLTWEEMLDAGEAVWDDDLAQREESLHPDDVINMQYTSGTTGFPKGVMLTHNNIMGNAHRLAASMKLTSEDRLCIPVPFFHCFGCVIGTLTAVSAGATMVPVVQFNPKEVLDTVEKEKCTALHGVPTMFIAELNHENFERYDLSSLRTGVMAGSTCPIEVMKSVINKMGMSEITIAYGQTETSPVFTQTVPDDPIEKRVETVGKPHSGVEVKVIDPVTGDLLKAGMQGELCTRGYHVMKGYYKMPEATANAIDSEGWLHTGDLAVIDNDGYVAITGRLKDMIIRGGENIYPREVEEFLYSHPSILDIQVIGIPDEKYGEKVAACVQLKEGEQLTKEELVDYCQGKISKFKIPEHIFIMKEYPMTASGKIQKYKLREEAQRLMNVKEGLVR